MSLREIRVAKGGAITIVDGKDTFAVTAEQRKRGDVTSTDGLRQILESSRGKSLSIPVHYYVAPSGNEYVIVGELPKPDRMPEMSNERGG